MCRALPLGNQWFLSSRYAKATGSEKTPLSLFVFRPDPLYLLLYLCQGKMSGGSEHLSGLWGAAQSLVSSLDTSHPDVSHPDLSVLVGVRPRGCEALSNINQQDDSKLMG